MRVYLCEKPSQARDIAKVLGEQGKEEGLIRVKGGVVTWCFGHLLEQAGPDAYLPEDLPKTPKGNKIWRMQDLPIIPSSWKVDVRRDARKQFGVVQKLLRSAEEVVIATDADREGEMIAREILDYVRYQGSIRRLWLSALDDDSIRKALSSLKAGEDTARLYDAALARSRADWLVGMNLTRAFSLRGSKHGVKGVLSVGRVQTPTLALVVARDREIEHFRPSPYWEVYAHLRVEHGGFRGRWRVPEDVADSEGRCVQESAAQAVKRDTEGQTGRIIKADTQRKKEAPPMPYDLSTLQAECSAKFGMGAQKVLDIAQALYETHKLTTYPRTDCGFLPESQHADAPVILKRLAEGDSSLAALIRQAQPSLKSGAWNDSKITAHHGIIPTAVVPKLEALNRDEFRVYDLIRKRYIAQFFPPHEYDQTSVEAEIAGHAFTASGRVSRLEGWKVVYARRQDDEADRADEDEVDDKGAAGEDQALPPMKVGEAARAERVDIQNKMTKPPRRYTEGTLLQAMKNVGRSVTDPKLKSILREKSGIGTEATRAGIIQTLLDREYLIKKKKDLISTEKARSLIDALPEHVRSPVMTALWEQSLEDIAEGRRTLEAFVKDQSAFVGKIVEMVRQEIGNDAGGGQGGSRHVDRPHADCPACGGAQTAVRLHSPKTGRDFWKCEACETFFEDKEGSLDVEAYVKKKAQLENAPECPICKKGRLVRREGSRGPFWSCNAYPKCRAITGEKDGQPDMDNLREPEERRSGTRRRTR